MATLHYLTTIILILPSLCYSIENHIQLGSELAANSHQSWTSENNSFVFGFVSTDYDDEFLLAIWYNNIPGDPTIVWCPNRDIPVGRDAIVKLDNSGNLVLFDRNTSVWMSNTTNSNVTFAELSEFGNFILYSLDEVVIWQSFSHPSDTLLPSQVLSISMELTSTKSDLGYYSLKMNQQRTSISLALTYVYGQINSSSFLSQTNYSYWSSLDISNATGDVKAKLDESGNFGISYGTSSTGTVYVHKNDTGGNHPTPRRITIGNDGNLRLYRWDYNGNAGQWVTEWSAVDNPCSVAGICGSGICNLDSRKTSANCTCLPGSHSVAPSNERCPSSLPPLTSGNCTKNQSHDIRMQTVVQTNYYFSGYSTISNYSGVSMGQECADRCLADCNCIASVYGLLDDSTYCWTLKSLVFGGQEDPGSTLYLKISRNNSESDGTSSNRSKGRERTRVLLPLILCFSVLLMLLGVLLCYYIQKKRMQLHQRMLNSCISLSGAPLCFSYHELHTATSNFSQLIGTGAFGKVYKGTLRDGTLVAVKKLDKLLPHAEKEFVTEVTTIGSMHHMNLVTLQGFCSEHSHRLLVYEYMSNGSLDKWLFTSNQNKLLDWKIRFNIVLGVAQGITYFHEQCRNRIIHCDIKPENILLDENFYPKICDFGLAKLMTRQHSQVVTMVRGTRGYLAPEWISNRPITVKADVYSYGMLLLEIVGGRRNLDMSLDAEEFYYPGFAFKEIMKDTPLRATDKRLENRVDEEELLRALYVAFWCIQEEPMVRPSMGEVVKMLEGLAEINVPPIPNTVLEIMEEGLHNVYKAIKGDYVTWSMSSSALAGNRSSQATCSYTTMSPR